MASIFHLLILSLCFCVISGVRLCQQPTFLLTNIQKTVACQQKAQDCYELLLNPFSDFEDYDTRACLGDCLISFEKTWWHTWVEHDNPCNGGSANGCTSNPTTQIDIIGNWQKVGFEKNPKSCTWTCYLSSFFGGCTCPPSGQLRDEDQLKFSYTCDTTSYDKENEDFSTVGITDKDSRAIIKYLAPQWNTASYNLFTGVTGIRGCTKSKSDGTKPAANGNVCWRFTCAFYQEFLNRFGDRLAKRTDTSAIAKRSGDVPPASWNATCPPEYYDAGDGCDCNCGAYDPDCAAGGYVFNCPNGNAIGCSLAGQCIYEDIPTGWTCDPSFYNATDGCDCACGIPDPDCDSEDPTVFNCPCASQTCTAGVCTGSCFNANAAITQDQSIAIASLVLVVVLIVTLLGVTIYWFVFLRIATATAKNDL